MRSTRRPESIGVFLAREPDEEHASARLRDSEVLGLQHELLHVVVSAERLDDVLAHVLLELVGGQCGHVLGDEGAGPDLEDAVNKRRPHVALVVDALLTTGHRERLTWRSPVNDFRSLPQAPVNVGDVAVGTPEDFSL